jgi:aryl-alcohol dehydrogenase-like predicted oxidoreductase
MERRAFGRTGMHVAALGFGAAEIGFENTDDHTVNRLLAEALDLGVNVIDTAAMYLDSEEKIGRYLRGNRDRVMLFTKCGRHPSSRNALSGLLALVRGKPRKSFVGADEHDPLVWHPRVLERNIEQSLFRLKTDRIDLIQLHTCSEVILRRGEVIEVLQRARQAGKVRHIGYSGDGEAALFAVRCGHFEALQTSINVADQDVQFGAIRARWKQVAQPNWVGQT